MSLLSLKNLSKRFDKTPAVTEVSLDVERGEFFGLLGPSGCGKDNHVKDDRRSGTTRLRRD